jgi:hypothetical protein
VRQSRILLRKTSLRLSCGLRPCAGFYTKKGQAKLALFWCKSNAKPKPGRRFKLKFQPIFSSDFPEALAVTGFQRFCGVFALQNVVTKLIDFCFCLVYCLFILNSSVYPLFAMTF